MTRNEPTIFIVDDDAHSRNSIFALVGSMQLKARTFASAEEFLDAYNGEPGCLVTDLRLPGRSAIELLASLQQGDRMLPTIVITAYAEISVAVEVMRTGAITLLEKPYRENELWNAIREGLQQDARSRAATGEAKKIRLRIEKLTPRESSVMKLILDGIPNKAVAAQLAVSLRTVEACRQTLFEKMEVDSVARLVQDVIIAQHDQHASPRFGRNPDT